MKSRMSKYYNQMDESNSRYVRNQQLYKEINKSELENYNVKSNAVVIGESNTEMDIEKIKKILDTKYNEVPKRRSIRLEKEEQLEEEPKETTKEYDINVVLEKAKEEKEENYQEDRFKKLHNTQYDILKKIVVEKEEQDEQNEEEKEDDLKNLIDTIAFNEKLSEDVDPLDVLTTLKGDDDTEVLEGLKEKVEEKLEEDDKNEIKEEKEVKKDKKEEKKEEKNPKLTDKDVINSFYTTSNAIKSKDFEDLKDRKKDGESKNIFLKFIIVIVIIAFIVGVALVIKTIYFK